MNVNYKVVGFSSFCATAIGFALAALIINSENGYVGSLIFIPIFFLTIFISFILLIISIIGFAVKKKSFGMCLLFSAILLPTSFMTSCLTAKYFEIGAYRQQPMIPLLIH